MKGIAPEALSGLAEKLEGEQVERALDAALAIEDEGYRAEALSGLAGVLEGEAPEVSSGRCRRRWRSRMKCYRAEALSGLAEKLEGEKRQVVLERALQAALAIGDEGSRARGP